MLSHATIHYAAPPPGSYWKWSSGYDAIEWSDGGTLALWTEVHSMLAYLGKNDDLPRFGSMLLLIAACRNDWPATADRIRPILHSVMEDQDTLNLDRTFQILDCVHSLPADLRDSMAAKTHLAATFFKGGPYSTRRQDTEKILSDFSATGPKAFAALVAKPTLSAKSTLLRDCRALLTGATRIDPEKLESLLRTGLEEWQLEFELEEVPLLEDRNTSLLDLLAARGGEAALAASVARRAIAMMSFPGHLAAPPELPIGGIADITNRGSVDRLLPGELAWDDLILAARLVHNEALYFRREIPPQHTVVSHTVLLSRELRLWGQGRILSLGLALGLCQHPALRGRGRSFECVAATVEDFDHLDLATADGVAAALETLVPLNSPLHLVESWWEEAQRIDDPALPDVSLILAEQSLKDAKLIVALSGLGGWLRDRGGRLRTLAIERDGWLEIREWSAGGNGATFRGLIQEGISSSAPSFLQ